MSFNLFQGFCLFGSTGQDGLTQPSSFVGKTTIAKNLVSGGGFKICSLADEIRFCLSGEPVYGDIDQRNFQDRPVEPPEFKEQLVALGEGFNEVEPYGWVSMAILKMFINGGGKFVVDDVRRVHELTALEFFGLQSVEIQRSDGLARQYDSDGRLGGIADHLVINTGEPSSLTTITKRLLSAKQPEPKLFTDYELRGVLRAIYHMASGNSKFEMMEDPAYRTYINGELHPNNMQVLRVMAFEGALNAIRCSALEYSGNHNLS